MTEELKRKRDSDEDGESDFENEVWEEVVTPVMGDVSLPEQEATANEVSFQVQVPATGHSSRSVLKRTRITKELRLDRTLMHQVHLLSLVVAAKERNHWTNNLLLQNILVSIVPKNVAEKKGNCVEALVRWWKDTIDSTPPPTDSTPTSTTTNSTLETLIQTAFSGVVSLLPNVRVLLFTSICRALNLNTRLVASLHPIPLSFAQAALDPCYRVSKCQTEIIDSEVQETPLETSAITLWTQIHIPATNSYVNVSCNGEIVPDSAFEPAQTAPDQQQLVYVLAFNQDGAFRDVSELFNTRWAGRVGKLRPKSSSSDRENENPVTWWKTVTWLGSGDIKSASDLVEDDKLKKGLVEREVIPTRLDGFKNNSVYALERHCTQSELVYPSGPTHAIGKFKGELVYPRRLVKEVFSAVNWRKRGQSVKEGEIPIKKVKARVNTIAKKREIELDRLNADLEGGGVSEWTDLYGEWQTQPCVPETLVNGKIPRNRFGNFEILHENMMPEWGARVKLPGASQVAKKLGIDCVPVMIGFEYHKGRATPVIQGVIVLKENKELLLEACREDAIHSQSKADLQKSKRAISNWRKLVEKAIIMSDLKDRYL
ncbi:Rad4 beta-hairpin domain 3-domain-containing protein [Obelidium mucronatum]|nr:Rad4 beta-hairpin domain 3-domain-containing protein [Obelidium mucronatum]